MIDAGGRTRFVMDPETRLLVELFAVKPKGSEVTREEIARTAGKNYAKPAHDAPDSD